MTALTTAASLLTHPFPATTTLGPARNRVLPGLAARGAPTTSPSLSTTAPTPTPPPLPGPPGRPRRPRDLLPPRLHGRTRPGLVHELHAAGHEIAVHGWHHRSLLFRGPRATHTDLARARDFLAGLTGEEPRLFRPPYGVMTTAAHLSARRLNLRPTLWTSWGEDWTARATSTSVLKQVTKDLHGGGTILLHDTDCTAKPNSWHSTLGAVPLLLDHCEQRGWKVGPLREHGRVSGR
ncbi:polysaccharide deacetylase family protein [Catenulispora yoronensis]